MAKEVECRRQRRCRNAWRKETIKKRRGVNKGAEKEKVRRAEEEIRWCKSGSEKERGAKERRRREGCRGPFSVESNPS